MKADLHIHTILSDGRFSAKEVIDEAVKKEIDIISITDHDLCANVFDHKRYAEEVGIKLIPGIELSTVYNNKPVHLLGYFTDDSYKNKEMTDYYKKIKFGRENRTRKFIKNLKDYYNIEITYEEVKSMSNGIIARPHIAKTIANKYPEYNFNYVFKNFINDDNKAYLPSCEIGVSEGIELLKRNNCIVVLAHPVLLKETIKHNVLNEFVYDGIEAKYLLNSELDELYFKNYAKKRCMIITAGSDFHGIPNDKNHAEIGDVYLEGEELELFLSKFNR